MAKMTDEEASAYAAYQIMQDPLAPYIPCLLCGGRAEYIGVFLPKEKFARRIGIPKGKRQAIGYKICLLCNEEPDVVERIEALMLEDMEVQ